MTFFSGNATSYTTSAGSNFTVPIPVIDYGSRDYGAIIQDMVNRIPTYLPEWTSNSPSDFGVVMIQMFAYVGDILNYYLDRLASEMFIQTATQPESIINLAQMLNYSPSSAAGATTTLQITMSQQLVGPFDIPAGSIFSTQGSLTQAPIQFQTVVDLVIPGNSAATPSWTGLVSAVQAVTYTSESVAISNGTVNQAYSLQNSPVNSGSPVVYVETDPSVGPQAWSFVQDLISSNQYDEVYTLFIDANGLSNIVFGDGINGYVPPYGSQITCTYQTTSGSLGNVGVNTVIQSVAAVVGLQSVTNITPASGGADPESLSSIAQKAPASLRTLSRAVTVGDFSTLAIQVPGVQWAQALMATYQLVNLYIAPAGISDDAPSTLLVSAVQEYMVTRTMGNTTVTVLGPTYVPVNITVEVFCYPNYADSAVLSAVKAALVNTLSLSNTGFGFRISVGLVYQVVLGVAGVNYALVTVLNRQFMCYLSTALVYGDPVSTLYTTELPEQVSSGDKLVITNLNLATPATETVTVSSSSVAGSLSIPVITFTPNANYPIESMVEDITGVNDCVMLPNEIPVAGTLNVTVTGGISS